MKALAILCILIMSGCGEPQKKDGPLAVEEAKTSERAPDVTRSSEAKPALLPVDNSKAQVKDAAPLTKVKESKGPLSFEEAMKGILACTRSDDGLRLEEPLKCLKGVHEARSRMLSRSPLRDQEEQLGAILGTLLTHQEPTLVFYVLSEFKENLRANKLTLTTLKELLSSPLEPIAEAASTARLALIGAERKTTRALALSLFSSHEQRRVRYAACQHLGQAFYKGDREIFGGFIDTARNADADLLVRSCSAREAARISTSKDLKTLISLLDIPDVQQAVVMGLQRAIGTPKAIDAYVRWFGRHATKAEKIHWTAMQVFLPWDTELAKMPRKATIRVLSRIAAHEGHELRTRTKAIEGLKRLKAEEALEQLQGTLKERTKDSASKELLEALRK